MEDQGRSGLKEQHKSLSLSKKNRGASLERQAIAGDSEITELPNTHVTALPIPIESSPHVKLDPAFVSILKKKVHFLANTENGLSHSLVRIKHLEEQPHQEKNSHTIFCTAKEEDI